MPADPRIEAVARLTAAFRDELAGRDPDAGLQSPTIPTVAALAVHLGGVHRWVAEILRTRRATGAHAGHDVATGSMRGWFEDGRADLLDVLAAVPAEAPCWVLGDRIGTAAFWRRRMVFENVKHLMDLRAAGGDRWEAAPELAAADYADGIDELLTEFLPRSRPTLAPLPGAVVLRATDSGRTWRIGADWTIDGATTAGEPAEILARTGDLALMLWERADPLEADGRFRVRGGRDAVAALRAAPIHPW